jgi:hypothetical protein
MRARRGLFLGWLVVGGYAAALVLAVVTTRDGELRPGDRGGDAAAADDLIEAWERSRTATFVRIGTFERRSEDTGSAITSEDVLAQRPPRRIHRQLGGVDGRDDRRTVLCPAPSVGSDPPPCTFGEPEGPTYDEDVHAEVDGLRSLVTGPSPVYAVGRGAAAGCFELAQLRVEPRAPFGIRAHLCFDDATGAPTDSRVEYAGGIIEVIAVTGVRAEVTDADLQP